MCAMHADDRMVAKMENMIEAGQLERQTSAVDHGCCSGLGRVYGIGYQGSSHVVVQPVPFLQVR
jgi:hypothetical protein